MSKIFISYLIFIFLSWNLLARNVGETEITTDEGIEVFQNEKFYLLKKNVQIISDTFSLSGDEVKVPFLLLTSIVPSDNISVFSK